MHEGSVAAVAQGIEAGEPGESRAGVVLLNAKVVAPALGSAQLANVAQTRLEVTHWTVAAVVAVVYRRKAGKVLGRTVVEANEHLGVAAFVAHPGEIGVAIKALNVTDNVTQKGIGLLGGGNDSVVDCRSLGTKVPRGTD